MSKICKIKRLNQSYAKHIAVPWRDDAASAQRVIFCVYDEAEELKFRAAIEEFEISTKEAGHTWVHVDLTDTFAKWLSHQRYAKSYFEKPHLLSTLMPKYAVHISELFQEVIDDACATAETVVALSGVGTLFGFLKVKDVVDLLAPKVAGRLLVFFPGSYENNNYRLLDGYDGWNYLAVPITADNEF